MFTLTLFICGRLVLQKNKQTKNSVFYLENRVIAKRMRDFQKPWLTGYFSSGAHLYES